jgi:hypothetical protein
MEHFAERARDRCELLDAAGGPFMRQGLFVP